MVCSYRSNYMESLPSPEAPNSSPYFALWLGKAQNNRSLIDRTRQLLDECNYLRGKLDDAKNRARAKKRARRTAKEIDRLFPCHRCGRAYG